MSSDTEAKITDAGSAAVDTSAASSPGTTGLHGAGSGRTSLSLLRTDATSSSATLSPLVENPSDTAQTDAVSLSGRKQRLSFKDRQRQRAGASGSTDLELRAIGGRPAHSPMSTASSSSPLTLDLSPGREHPLPQSALKRTTAAASPPLTACIFTEMGPSSRGSRAGAPRAPTQTPITLASPDALTAAVAVEEVPNVPDSMVLRAASSNFSFTSKPTGSLHEHSGSLASASQLGSPLTLHPQGTASAAAAAPPPHLPSSLLCTSVSLAYGNTAAQTIADDTEAPLPKLRTPTTLGSATTSSTEFGSRNMEEMPILLPVSSTSTSSPGMSFKDRQRAAVAARKPFIAAGSPILAGSPPRGAVASSSFTAPSEGSVATPSSLPAANTAQLTPRSPAAALPERVAFRATTPVMQVPSLPSGYPSLSTASPLQRLGPAAQDPTEQVSADRDCSTGTEGTSELPATRPLPRLPVAQLTTIESLRPSPPPPATVPPALASHLKRCGPSGPSASNSTKPQFRFFAQGWQAEKEEDQDPGAISRRHSGQARWLRDSSGSAGTASTNPADADVGERSCVDEEESLLACTQNEARLHFYDANIESTPMEFNMASPYARYNTNSSASASRDSGVIETRISTEHSETMREGPGQSQTMPSMLTSESGSDVMKTACLSKPLRCCTRARTESLDVAPQSTGSSTASRLVCADGLQTSLSTDSPQPNFKLEQHHYTDNAFGTTPLPGVFCKVRARASGTIVDRWRQYQQVRTSQGDAHVTRGLSSTQPTRAPALSENSVSLSSTQLSCTARPRRRHRSKMLAPDGAPIAASSAGRRRGAENSCIFSSSSLRHHRRSHTLDDIALLALASGNRSGAMPGSVTPEPLSPSSRSTAGLRSIVNARFPPLPTHTAVASSHGVFTGLANVRRTRDDLPMPLGPIPAAAFMLTETSGGSSGSGSESANQSLNAGVVSIFSSGVSQLPTVPQQANSQANSLGKASSALTSAMIAPAPSVEDLSATTPTANAGTPAGCSSVDELSTHTMRRRSSVVESGACPSTGGGAAANTANPGDAEDSDGDYQQRTIYSYYGGDSIVSATTAELRKLRRRSTYSSLHYGTMTSFHHKCNEQQQGGRVALQHGRHRSGGGSRRRRHRTGPGVDSKESTALFSQSGVFAKDSAGSRTGKVDTDDGIETIWDQRGSDEAGASNEEEGRFGEAAGRQWCRHRGNRAKDDAVAAAASAVAADDDDGDAAQRRTVGMWTSVEHVFLPRYEVVPEAASKTPLTVLASPKSNPNTSISAVNSDPEAKLRHGFSLESIPHRKKSATPNLTPASDQQPPHPLPSADASPASIPAGSPSLGAADSHLMTPAPLTPKGSPSMYPGANAGGSRPSGLVVLPDADCSADARASVSLSCSQFRRTPAQASGTMRLEPEDFTFGTVAAEYNMDPADEEELPQGSCDAKVAARLIFDPAAGVMLMDPEDEVGRYERHGHMSPDDRGSFTAPLERMEEGSGAKGDHDACDDEANDGACHCDAAFIAKDFKGLDCSRYDANDLYDHCSRCHRRPAAFLCLHCLEAVCPSHVRRHHLQNPSACTLFLNLLDIMNSFDRIFWCEKCQQFTWKHTEVYDALVDQIAFTRGTYLKQPARDIHCVGYEVRLKDVTASAAVRHAPELAVGAEAPARVHSMDKVPPAAVLHKTPSGLWIPASLQHVTFSPTTEAFTALEMLPASATALQQISNASALPNGGAQLPMRGDAGALGLSPKSPPSGCAPVRQRPTTVANNSLSQPPVHSPMQQFLNRDLLEFSAGNTVTVGEPVTKLCALAASVQGWRTTQEDAEAVFLVDIPALSEEVVNRKELREVAVAAAAAEAAAKNPLEGLDGEQTHGPDSSLTVHGSCERSASSASESSPEFNSALRLSDSGTHERPNMGDEEAAPTAAGAASEEAEGAPKETMPMAVFCMFDGHGGDAVAKLAARHFEAHLRRAIEETRPDDVRARALLFFLKAETDSAASTGAAAPWLPQSVSATPMGDGILNYVAPLAASMTTPAGPAASSPPLSLDAASGRIPDSHLSSPFHRPSGSAALSVPFDRFSAKRSEANGDETASPPKTADVPFTLADELRNTSFAGSLSVLVPVTAESLRLHAAGATLGLGDAGVKETSSALEGGAGAVGGKNRHSASTRADTSFTANKRFSNSHSSNRNRKSGVTLDAWEAVEEPLPDMVSVAAGVGSPRTGVLLPRPIAAAEELRHWSRSSQNPSPSAGNVAICPSPAAVVSIPEMEMLRQYFASIMEDALMSLDDYLRSTPEGVRGDYNCVGCTACVVGITANFVLCANVGDSGAAFYTKDRMKVISVKHRVSDEAEQARIHAAGYNIINGRIEGMSAVPRALGDFDFKQCGGRGPRKQAVSAVPDVTIMPVPNDTDQWGIVLACDGVWDTATLHQVHVALTNTVNDLAVSGSAMDAVLRGAELYQNRLRGPSAAVEGLPWSSSPVSPPRAGGPSHSSEALDNNRKTLLSTKGGSFTSRAVTEESMIRYYDDDDDSAAPRLSHVDAILLTAAAGVFAQCVAPEDNDEGVGLDNCSLIIVERRNVQE